MGNTSLTCVRSGASASGANLADVFSAAKNVFGKTDSEIVRVRGLETSGRTTAAGLLQVSPFSVQMDHHR